MTPYSVPPRDQKFVKGCGFLYFAKNICSNIGKNVSKDSSSKYSQKLLDHAKTFAADALKTASKRTIQKPAKATGDLIGDKIADRITKVSNTLPHNNSEIVTNEGENIGLDRERYISPEKRKQMINDLRLI